MACKVDHKRVADSKDSALLWVLEPERSDHPWGEILFTHCPACGERLVAEPIVVTISREDAERPSGEQFWRMVRGVEAAFLLAKATEPEGT